MIRILFAVLLALCSSASMSQGNAGMDGNRLVKLLDAYDRMRTARTASEEDFGNAMLLIGYMSGVVQTHQQNNLLFAVIAMAASEKKNNISPQTLRTASAFVPLLKLPDNVSPDQLAAILRRYLNAHPEKWHTGAYALVQDALSEAFPRQ